MFKKDATDTSSNFWISYADLMAGLLFVFILLIGAIVSKSIILKSDLHDKEDRLLLVSQTLKNKEAMLDDTSVTLAKNKKRLEFDADEIKKLNKLLLEANTKKDQFSKKILIVQNILDTTESALQKNKKSLEEYEGKVLILSNKLTDANKTTTLKDEQLLALLNALDEKQTKYDELLDNLQKQKAKIKSLTGIKLKVIAALKEALGDKIDIDKKTGSLRLASNILFAKGEDILKDEAKVELKKAFEEYIGTLVTNTEIRPHLDQIIIEGHTDSDGDYIYNLNLSQKRALAVMTYLLTLEFSEKYNIKPLMIASGRGYLDAIMKDGVEDKNASRRIEIKFRLKNEDAMNEIEKVLDAE